MDYKNVDTTVSGGVVMRKGLSGAIVSAIALGVVSSFPDLTPEQRNAATVALIGILESLRNLFKRKFPRIFPFF
jgi:hypothetical protein